MKDLCTVATTGGIMENLRNTITVTKSYKIKNEKRVLNAFWTAFPTHLKRVAGKAFESISDRLRNAPEMCLWQCVLDPFENTFVNAF